MQVEMLVPDTGLLSAKVCKFVSIYLEENKQMLEKLSVGSMMRTHRVFENENERFECLFCYFKKGTFSLSRIEVFINGNYVANVFK
ncbi:TPA: hypothetical protein U2D46_001237 [Streptococcus suis]|uniref:Uncharacterized protein n=1 Tax=Streptococcus suis TaxID=1307 RepID=A0AAW9DI61_STRSU|nr:hypothetical protein [Streptococcus suis]AUC92715.1 hypothetical protein CWM22_12850 [Streptococcus suis]MCK3891223.1 hypothetical protein [Streptococcus suis]MDW8650022.1 hypothetical protein [Streptococcus suis]MDW8713226.1 hypothetical protein [Streptococcus suis]MDX4991559.1 hypothetical protein [Streptococcus suis]